MITLGTIFGITTILLLQQQAYTGVDASPVERKAPVEVSGYNIYIAWWTNKTGNDEVMFRISTDAGKTLSDSMNLSNSPTSDSQDVQLSEDEGKIAVSWWERNQTSNESVMRISTDNGKTFGDIINLSAKGPIG